MSVMRPYLNPNPNPNPNRNPNPNPNPNPNLNLNSNPYFNPSPSLSPISVHGGLWRTKSAADLYGGKSPRRTVADFVRNDWRTLSAANNVRGGLFSAANFVRGGQCLPGKKSASSRTKSPRRIRGGKLWRTFWRTVRQVAADPIGSAADPLESAKSARVRRKVRQSPPMSANLKSAADTGADTGGLWRTLADTRIHGGSAAEKLRRVLCQN